MTTPPRSEDPSPRPHAIPIDLLPPTLLVGAGVVGIAIAQAHVQSEIPFCLTDQDAEVLDAAAAELILPNDHWGVSRVAIAGLSTPCVCVEDTSIASNTPHADSWLIIESIVERLDVKQAVFNTLANTFGPTATYCSNTSNLRIHDLAAGLTDASGFCGMHFFMPVAERHAVEIVGHGGTSQPALMHAAAHASRLGKEPITVGDGPGFLVNRMLSPYINQAMLLLTTGAPAEQIEVAAKNFGMPMSPLELIDWIGSRTLFHAGKTFWQSFPERLDPSPMVAGLVKNDRPGRAGGRGFYDYQGAKRSEELSPKTLELIERYRTEDRDYTDLEVEHLLAIPMWLESMAALKAGIARDADQVATAMRCGLGYRHNLGWQGYFNRLGRQQIDAAIEKWSDAFKSMRMPSGWDG